MISSDENYETTAKVSWPSPQDFSEAVQTPLVSFADLELRAGKVTTSALGLPICMSGNFASVFCFDCGTKKVAVRCFLHNVPDQQARYSAISKYVCTDELECTVPFEYQEQGVQVYGKWFPILKMEWVDGVTLNQFISQHLSNAMALNLLAGYFKDMVLDMQKAGLAHGDLQHDNILISDGSLRLVDYDGLYVPALKGMLANELGHANYQHPLRNERHFGTELDNFSAWNIFVSLRAISLDPSLMHTLEGGADCILFRKADLVAPEQSKTFALLGRHDNELIRGYAAIMRHLLSLPVEKTPSLSTPLAQMSERSLKEAQAMELQYSLLHSVAEDGSVEDSNGAGESQISKKDPQPVRPLPEWVQQPPDDDRSLSPAVRASRSNSIATALASALGSSPPPDPYYPEFKRIDIPVPLFALTPEETKELIVPALLTGETIVWESVQSGQSSFLDYGNYKMVLDLVFGATGAIAFIFSLLLHPSFFLGLAILISAFLVYNWLRPYPREYQSLALLTNKRFILVARRGQKSVRPIAHSFPVDEIADVSEFRDGNVILYARNKFKISDICEPRGLTIAVGWREAFELRRLMDARNASRAASQLVIPKGTTGPITIATTGGSPSGAAHGGDPLDQGISAPENQS